MLLCFIFVKAYQQLKSNINHSIFSLFRVSNQFIGHQLYQQDKVFVAFKIYNISLCGYERYNINYCILLIQDMTVPCKYAIVVR